MIQTLFVLFFTLAKASSLRCERVFTNYSFTPAQLSLASEERKHWIDDKNQESQEFFKQLPSRMWFENYFRKVKAGDTVLQTKSVDGAQTQLDLIFHGLSQPGDLRPTELIKTDASGNKTVLLSSFDFSKKGDVMIRSFYTDPLSHYALVPVESKGSIDVAQIHVIDLRTGKRLEVVDVGEGDAAAVTWLGQDAFFYVKRTGRMVQGFLHHLGEPSEKDISSEGIFFKNSSNKKFALMEGPEGFREFQRIEDSAWTSLPFEPKDILDIKGEDLWVIKKGKKGFGELATLKLSRNAEGTGFIAGAEKVLIPESDKILKRVVSLGDTLYAQYSWGSQGEIRVISGGGGSVIPIPASSSILDFVPTVNGVVTVSLTSPLVPKKSFTYDLKEKKYIGENPTDAMMLSHGVEFVTDFQIAKSADGTDVPVRVVHKKGLILDGSNPTLIQGYGGFGDNGYFVPAYSEPAALFLRSGGVYVTPAMRGEGYFGPEWEKAGHGLNKQNTVNDFIAAVELLIRKGYTSPKHLAAMGWSHGGFLMGAVLVQRPDLFSLVIPGAGVFDLRLKTKDGGRNKSEYGNADDPSASLKMKTYSPLDNVKPQSYPTVVVIAGENDSRVPPEESYKFANQLMASQTGPNPVLLTTVRNGGHFVSSLPFQGLVSWRANVRIWSAIFDMTGLKPQDP